jgi:hypothetical protein
MRAGEFWQRVWATLLSSRSSRPSRSRSRCSVSCYGGHPDLLRTIFGHLGAYLPGLVRDGQHPEGLIPVQAPKAVALTISGVIAFVVLVLAGLGWLRATRVGIVRM